MKDKNPGICLIGLGPHAKRIYYDYIGKDVLDKKLNFYLLVDLFHNKDDIEDFCLRKKIKPENIFLSKLPLSSLYKKIDPLLLQFLNKSIKKKKIKYAIISTEPKAHKVYIEYFIRNRIPVLTDKPITSPIGANYNKKSAETVLKDAEYLFKLSKKYNTPIYIQAQRREHTAYQFVFDEIKKIIKKYRMPITFFDIYHSDGQWNMPGEYLSRENHPYKYGYGKIMHSGYHFVDLVSWIIESNKIIYPNLYISNSTKLLKPGSHYRQINGSIFYKDVFKESILSPQNYRMGEVDSYTNFILKDSNNTRNSEDLITFGNLNMLQSGFSKRAWFQLPVDTYKGNGRLRHEYFNINVGPLLNIQLHSYQSEEKDRGPKEGVGSRDHLDVYVFRNEKLIGGKPFEIINFDQRSKKEDESPLYLGHNESARYIIYRKMIDKLKSDSLIENQILTNKIICSMYKSSISNKRDTFKL